MDLTERQNKILSMIRRDGRALVDELAGTFSTTPQTIRKDLQALANHHQIVRFHGGAALLAGVEYGDYNARRRVAADQKMQIGRKVASMIPASCTLFINGGTTTEQVAKALEGKVGLQIITDNIGIAEVLRHFNAIDVLVAGGRVRRADGTVTGTAAVEFLNQFRADYAVIGAAAIDEDGGLLDYDLQEIQLVKTIMNRARHIILVADTGKFQRQASVCFGHLKSVNTLVTSTGVTSTLLPGFVAPLCERHNVDLVTV